MFLYIFYVFFCNKNFFSSSIIFSFFVYFPSINFFFFFPSSRDLSAENVKKALVSSTVAESSTAERLAAVNQQEKHLCVLNNTAESNRHLVCAQDVNLVCRPSQNLRSLNQISPFANTTRFHHTYIQSRCSITCTLNY